MHGQLAHHLRSSERKGHPPFPGKHGEILRRRGEVGKGKLLCWSINAAISLKRVKIEETLLWRAYRNSPTLFRTIPSPSLYGLLFQDWGSQPSAKTRIATISGTGEATDFKFGRNIHRIHPNKSPLKCWTKWSLGVSNYCPNFWGIPYYLRKR